MRIALCPGSFDPITNGHLDIIERAAHIFDQVLVTVFYNTTKDPMFTVDERMALAREATKNIPNVQVDSCQGLLIDYARARGVNAVIKGLRAVSDFEYEFQMAQMNKQFSEHVETLFMMTRPQHSYLSSSIVKELARFGADITPLVPAVVAGKLTAKFKENSELARRPYAAKEE